MLKFLVYLVLALAFSSTHAGAYEDFQRALIRNDAPALRQLLQRGVDPNSRDEQGQVALYAALRAEAFDVAEVLLAHPQLDVDAANAAGETPMMIASLRGLTPWQAKLAARGAKVHHEGWSPVLYAASSPEPKAVLWLLERGAPANARSPNGTTPLMMAAGYGAEASVDLLLARGADPRARNDRELTAADFARRAGRDKLADRLQQLAR